MSVTRPKIQKSTKNPSVAESIFGIPTRTFDIFMQKFSLFFGIRKTFISKIGHCFLNFWPNKFNKISSESWDLGQMLASVQRDAPGLAVLYLKTTAGETVMDEPEQLMSRISELKKWDFLKEKRKKTINTPNFVLI